jgi:hypothetical protein
MIFYVYHNGEFFYKSYESHYKHGRPIATCPDIGDATRLVDRWNSYLDLTLLELRKARHDAKKVLLDNPNSDYRHIFADLNAIDMAIRIVSKNTRELKL